MNRTLRTTADGSATLFVPELNEHYHSVHGAVQESNHVFIQAGLKACKSREISILEMGFGTGLNAWLTAIYAAKNKLSINYTALEKYPLVPEEWRLLNYTEHASHKQSGLFQHIHQVPWETKTEISEHFALQKIKADFADFNFEETQNAFHLIYFDAFAPSTQPDLWTTEMFLKMYNSLKQNGLLVTYCAQGQVKRNMKAAGFKVEALPGPPGKREMTRAIKPL